MLFHLFVRWKTRRAFQRLSAGDNEPLLKLCSPFVRHTFPGNHPCGGRRHTVAGLRRWFERLFLLFPNLRFEVQEILVEDWPWHTVVAVRWTDRATPRDGQPYVNHGVHILRLRWGRLVSLHAYLDTQKVAEVCQRLAQQGIREAAAPPIED